MRKRLQKTRDLHLERMFETRSEAWERVGLALNSNQRTLRRARQPNGQLGRRDAGAVGGEQSPEPVFDHHSLLQLARVDQPPSGVTGPGQALELDLQPAQLGLAAGDAERASLEPVTADLLALDERAMVLEELDGFIAGLLVCPEPIPPGEWFARVVGLSARRPAPFADLDHANDVLGLVMDYYNGVATTLARQPQSYRPRFPVDEQSGDVLWEPGGRRTTSRKDFAGSSSAPPIGRRRSD